jgi:lactoylglutathione lyase
VLENSARVVHLALKVADLESATRFYEDVFGFRQTGTGYARGHVSRHMTDGGFDLALMVYDSEEEEEAQLSGPGPCVHHWGIQVRDRETAIREIAAHGGEIISRPDEGALKFRAPDGAVAEIVRAGRYRKAATGERARICGLSITTPDVDASSRFYKSVFGFEEIQDGKVRRLTDGLFQISLPQSREKKAAHHHWTVQVNAPDVVAAAIQKHGGVPLPEEELLYRTPDGSLLRVVPG